MEGKQWAAVGVAMTADINEIVNDIRLGTAVCVSDELFKDGFGIASWMLENACES